jgi:DNA-binding FadR family transcriptional regulator
MRTTAIVKPIRRGDISGTRSAISDHLSAVRDRMMADVERNGGSI